MIFYPLSGFSIKLLDMYFSLELSDSQDPTALIGRTTIEASSGKGEENSALSMRFHGTLKFKFNLKES